MKKEGEKKAYVPMLTWWMPLVLDKRAIKSEKKRTEIPKTFISSFGFEKYVK